MRVENGLEVDDLDRVVRWTGLGYPLAVHGQRQVQRSQGLHYPPELGSPLSRLDLHDPLAPDRGHPRQLLLGHAPRSPRPPDQMAEIRGCVDSQG